jgi:hypothetical protein
MTNKREDVTSQPPTDGADSSKDSSATRRADDMQDMREANKNIRKSQGDDAGQRPTIDRHR